MTTPTADGGAAATTPDQSPAVLSVRRDAVFREIRLELAEWRTRTGGVYDLSPDDQETLLLPGHLPGWGDFLPDFVIIHATADPADLSPATTATPSGQPCTQGVIWRDLRVHVGGIRRDAVTDPALRRNPRAAVSAEWSSLAALLGHLPHKTAAPGWLLGLIRAHTPWGALLDGDTYA